MGLFLGLSSAPACVLNGDGRHFAGSAPVRRADEGMDGAGEPGAALAASLGTSPAESRHASRAQAAGIVHDITPLDIYDPTARP
jgi:hypothetical protein